MKKLWIVLFLQHVCVIAFGQFTLKGVVTGNAEPLPGASIVLENTFYGTSSGKDGSFEFRNLKKGNYVIRVSFIGFTQETKTIILDQNRDLRIDLTPEVIMTGEVMVAATRADSRTPFAWETVSKEEIGKRNMGQDIPYMLQLTPSFVATSDAGAGVGYTNFRIRGTDLNRVNVTVNGIPLNDAESHGTWFVDQPDLASSLENIQVQRGVGTSTNGAAAFGATLNLQTNTLETDAYTRYKTAYGSFNTFKNTISAGTGLINGNFTLDARLSAVSSDGFINRAFSDLKSFFVSAGYHNANTMVKINVFSGLEETYQSWNGVPSVRLNDDLEGMQRYESHWLYSEKETQEMIASDSRTYNLYTYDNQVDHYQQDHFQLHLSHKISAALNVNTAWHYTHGKGYYENYKAGEDPADYQLNYPVIGTETVEITDLVNRKWLDNDFLGAIWSINYQKKNHTLSVGGGWNNYTGNHFGKVIWAQFYGTSSPGHEWYRNKGEKSDFHSFAKYNFMAGRKINLYADLQYRQIGYRIDGIDDDLRDITQKHDFSFFNPKVGITYLPEGNQKLYASLAVASREPNRDNFVDADLSGKPPVHETLYDWEAGYSFQSESFSAEAGFYFMDYDNQLVLTGQINDVGAPVMVNVDKSYRAGAEIQAGAKISNLIRWNGNLTFSKNKIKDFTEYVDNWDTWGQEANPLGTTNLSFSPEITSNSNLTASLSDQLEISLISSYVGKQFIDNTSSKERILPAYFVNHLTAGYRFATRLFREITLNMQINNLFNEKYESNAWVYSYMLGGERYKMDGYFPQAGRHVMFGLSLEF